MRFRLFRICLFMAFFISTMAGPVLGQRWKLRRYEIGGGIGMTQVFGDIGGTIDEKNWFGLKDIKIDETRMAFPMYARYRLDPVYAIKVNTVLGFGNGKDTLSRNDRGRSYKTTLFEFSAQGEYYFIAEERRYKSAAMFNRRGMLNNYMSVSGYLFLGIGGVYSRAKVTFTQDMLLVDRIKPNNLGMVIPFGIGLKYIIDDRWLVGAELGYRISMTDYIEGYSQTSDSKHNDVYYFLSLKVGYRLETNRRGIPLFLDKQYRQVNHKKSSTAKIKPKSKKEALE
jgi:OOP family OmpA-OmpF porin